MYNKIRFFWNVIYAISILCFFSGVVILIFFLTDFNESNPIGVSVTDLMQSIQNVWLMLALVLMIDLFFFRYKKPDK